MELEERRRVTLDTIKNTSIEKSSTHGEGLFATDLIEKDTTLCILDGQYIHYDFLKQLQKDNPNFHELEWNQVNNDLLLVRIKPTKYSLINHHKIPNCRLFTAPLRVLAIKNIEPGEELLLDYREEDLGDQYLIDHGVSYL